MSQSSAWNRLRLLKCSHLAILPIVSLSLLILPLWSAYYRAMTMHSVTEYHIQDSTTKLVILARGMEESSRWVNQDVAVSEIRSARLERRRTGSDGAAVYHDFGVRL
jgi:hypothetical protein